jgi:exodeoxyribonuclease V alpha subunit
MGSAMPLYKERGPPSSIEGIRHFLGSGMIKGIGPHFARQAGCCPFGEAVFDVIKRTT